MEFVLDIFECERPAFDRFIERELRALDFDSNSFAIADADVIAFCGTPRPFFAILVICWWWVFKVTFWIEEFVLSSCDFLEQLAARRRVEVSKWLALVGLDGLRGVLEETCVVRVVERDGADVSAAVALHIRQDPFAVLHRGRH